MTKHFNGVGAAARFTLAVAVVSLAACSTQGPTPPLGVEQRIETASSRLDHEEIAAQYDRQAVVDAAAAKRHHGYAQTYRRNVSPRSGVQAHAALAKHCERQVTNRRTRLQRQPPAKIRVSHRIERVVPRMSYSKCRTPHPDLSSDHWL